MFIYMYYEYAIMLLEQTQTKLYLCNPVYAALTIIICIIHLFLTTLELGYHILFPA